MLRTLSRLKTFLRRLFNQEIVKEPQIPIPYSISKNQLDSLLVECEQSLRILEKTVHDGFKPPPGAYAFFNHIAHALSRVSDLKKILDRLFLEVHSLVVLHAQQQKSLPKDWPCGVPFPESVQEIYKKHDQVNGLAQLDSESLYIFGQILLDQWSLLAIAVGNIPLKKVHPFVELVNYLEANPDNLLKPIWDEYSNQMFWLHFQVRFYRNRFIVHANRPWQRGTTRSVWVEEYNLHTPTPPGWLDDSQLDSDIKALLPLAPARIRDAQDDYWEKTHAGRLIEVLFQDIGNIDKKSDREKIAELFGKKGGSTPTFQIVAKNLLEFVHGSTSLLNTIAKNNLANVDLGMPNKTGHAMWMESDK